MSAKVLLDSDNKKHGFAVECQKNLNHLRPNSHGNRLGDPGVVDEEGGLDRVGFYQCGLNGERRREVRIVWSICP